MMVEASHFGSAFSYGLFAWCEQLQHGKLTSTLFPDEAYGGNSGRAGRTHFFFSFGYEVRVSRENFELLM